jgi:Tol biopolymer transport system component
VISDDGRFVAFASNAPNLVPGDTNNSWNVFLHDGSTGTTKLVSASRGGKQAIGKTLTSAISSDGRFVAFDSNASNLVAGDTNRVRDVFVRDLLTRTTERVSVSSNGKQANGKSFVDAISPSGRFVVFDSYASNLAAGDTNRLRNVFVRDLLTGETKLVSVASGG